MVDMGRRKQIQARMIQIRAELDQLIAEVEGEGGDPSPRQAARDRRWPWRRWLRPE